MENYGFLLLCSHLGNPDRKPLTTAQLRLLARRVMDCGPFSEGELTEKTLLELGFSSEGARHILALLEDQALLERYLQKAKARRCTPIQRRDLRYPAAVRKKLGLDSPGCLWAKGALELLDRPKVAAVYCGRKIGTLPMRQAARPPGRALCWCPAMRWEPIRLPRPAAWIAAARSSALWRMLCTAIWSSPMFSTSAKRTMICPFPPCGRCGATG